MLAFGSVGFFLVWRLKNDAAGIVDDTLPGLRYAAQINSELSENFARALLVINADLPEERDRYLKKISEGSAQVDESMDRYRNAIFEKEDSKLFARLATARGNYRAIRQRVFDLVGEDKREEGRQLFQSELLPAYTAQRAAGDALFDYNMEQGRSRGAQIEIGSHRTEWIVAILCTAVFLGGFFTPFIAIHLPPHIGD